MRPLTAKSQAQAESRIRESLVSTERFYETHAAEYFRRTVDVDLSHLYDRFLAAVPVGGRILDAGCGSGRDLREFVRRGYRATGIDASRALVRIAARHSPAPCFVMRFEDLSYENCFDAIWACASLLHVPKRMLRSVLHRLHLALVPGGVMFVSVQAGKGEALAPDGRFFARYTKQEFAKALKAAGFTVIEAWISKDVLAGRKSTRWINMLAVTR
jgi:SAM-dependent methyltransferase